MRHLVLSVVLVLAGLSPLLPVRAVLTGARAAAPVPAGVPMPNPSLTPGEAFKGVTAQQVCTPGYAARVRAVSEATKRIVFRRYGITNPVPGTFEIDHLISLELGGDNSLRNLWPQPYAGPAGAHQKDGLEDYLHVQVCAGRLALAAAQREIATN
jgi:hypothetical protein